jgi:hypothetical protein
MSGLTGLFVANTYQYLVLKQDIDKEEYTNGLGTPIYINGDPIGTIKMFYPIGGTLSNYFDSSGMGVTGSGWWGWGICDGRNGTPDLRGRFAVGMTDNNPDLGNPNANKTEFLVAGATGGSSQIDISNLPPHRHLIGLTSVNDSGTSQSINDLNSKISSDSKDITDLQAGSRITEDWSSSGTDLGDSIVWANSGDGTTNNNNRDELNSSPIDYNQPYTTVIYVIKII